MFQNAMSLSVVFFFVIASAMGQEKCKILTRCGDQWSLIWIDTNEVAEARLTEYEDKLVELAQNLKLTMNIVQSLTGCSSGHNCSEKAECVDQTFSYSCKCLPGYTGDGYTCEDINECSSPVCDANALCRNTGGSFACTCNKGFRGDGLTCIDAILDIERQRRLIELARRLRLPTTVIQSLKAKGCATTGHNCSDKAKCVDQTSSYSFSCECLPGYTGDGYTCEDINECSSAVCDANALCKNTEGSFTCICRKGYRGNGLTCIVGILDIESQRRLVELARKVRLPTTIIQSLKGCRAGHNCSDKAECVDQTSSNSFSCECLSGYTGDGYTCEDINECSSAICDANALCRNIEGSFTCTCNKGYRGDGLTCIECYVSQGHSYRGRVSQTKSGRTCQYWNSQRPHKHTRTRNVYPSAGLAQNYCRNPDDGVAPWCYTTDRYKRWEYCSVAKCN